MKKLFISLCLLCAATSVFSQKKYLNIYAWDYDIAYPTDFRLSGDIPEGIKDDYSTSDKMDIGTLLNMLAEKGYVVEFVSAVGHTGSKQKQSICYLLSKKVEPAEGSETTVGQVKAKETAEVKEVARYNLQGLPVKKSDKGLQIIVFSNYTTKTVLVE